MITKKILVVGSSNTDMVIKTQNFPAPGETILGGRFLMNAGGKGANQAVAAARLFAAGRRHPINRRLVVGSWPLRMTP